jgi:hypothetical protein
VQVIQASGTGENYKEITIGESGKTYGYDDHYLTTAAKILQKAGKIKKGLNADHELRDYIRNHRENVSVFCTDVAREKDL